MPANIYIAEIKIFQIAILFEITANTILAHHQKCYFAWKQRKIRNKLLGNYQNGWTVLTALCITPGKRKLQNCSVQNAITPSKKHGHIPFSYPSLATHPSALLGMAPRYITELVYAYNPTRFWTDILKYQEKKMFNFYSVLWSCSWWAQVISCLYVYSK